VLKQVHPDTGISKKGMFCLLTASSFSRGLPKQGDIDPRQRPLST
jgi:hypothetical protein